MLLLFMVAVAACGAPPPDDTGFVVLDEEARRAGLVLEVSGERKAGALPIAVDTRDDVVAVVRDGELPRAIEVAPEAPARQPLVLDRIAES
jgi:hypothetical protein